MSDISVLGGWISSVFSNPGWIALVGIRIINYIDHHALSAQI